MDNYANHNMQEDSGSSLNSIEDVLRIVQSAWPPHEDFNKYHSENQEMAQKFSSNKFSPPFLRRRFSTPEVVMRKHALNQQKADEKRDSIEALPRSSWKLYYMYWNRSFITRSESNLSSKLSSNKADSLRKLIFTRRLQSKESSLKSLKEMESKKYSASTNKNISMNENSSCGVQSSEQHFNNDQESRMHDFTSSDYETKNELGNEYSSFEAPSIERNVQTCAESEVSKITSSANGVSVTECPSDYQTNTTNSYKYSNYKSSTISTTPNLNKVNNSYTPTTIHYDKTNFDTNNNNFNSSSTTTSDINTVSNDSLNNYRKINLTKNELDEKVYKTFSDFEPNENNQKRESFYLRQTQRENINENQSKIIKYMISKVGAGSSYTKFDSSHLVVPRYSALPRSMSMEVNMSSPETTDRESDSLSLVDSLEDRNSPIHTSTLTKLNHDEKPVRGDLLIPASEQVEPKEQPKPKPQKGSAFYISIMQDQTNKNMKTVAEFLPERVRNRLSKRQKNMKQKILQNKKDTPRIDENFESDDTNFIKIDSNTFHRNTYTTRTYSKTKQYQTKPEERTSESCSKTDEIRTEDSKTYETKTDEIKSSDGTIKKPKPKYLQSLPSYKINSRLHPNINLNTFSKYRREIKQRKRRCIENIDSADTNSTTDQEHRQEIKSANLSTIKYMLELATKLSKARNKPKLDSNKNKTTKNTYTYKSKIPVPIQNHISLHKKQPYSIETDLKTDQLIANILIDTLNKPDMLETQQSTTNQSLCNEKLLRSRSFRTKSSSYERKVEMIVEEKLSSVNSSFDEALQNESKVQIDTKSDKKNEVEKQEKIISKREEKKFIATACQTDQSHTDMMYMLSDKDLKKDQNNFSAPKSCVRYYMIRKNFETPGSSTDEGCKKTNTEDKSDKKIRSTLMKREIRSKKITEDKAVVLRDEVVSDGENDSTVLKNDSDCSENSKNDSSLERKDTEGLRVTRQSRKQSHKRGRHRTSFQSQGTNTSRTAGEWSVTVSGTNLGGRIAPDVEMRLKFPCTQTTSQSDSGFGEEHPKQPKNNFHFKTADNNFRLPSTKPIQPIKRNPTLPRDSTDLPDSSLHNRSSQYLPDLIKIKNQKSIKFRENSLPTYKPRLEEPTCMPVLQTRGALTEFRHPRQTLTSFRRFSLHHSGHLSQHLNIFPNSILHNYRNSNDYLKGFPAIMTITGTAISSENKSSARMLD